MGRPRNVRDADGLTVKEGPFGMSLCTTKAFSKGELILMEHREKILIREFPSMADFESTLNASSRGDASYLLQHSVPAVSGIVVCMAEESPFSYLNHAHDPNVQAPYHHSDIDRPDRHPTDEFTIVALKDIAKDEYLCFDYNLCAGYDIRKDAPMIKFLALCAQYGEEKRPSKFV